MTALLIFAVAAVVVVVIYRSGSSDSVFGCTRCPEGKPFCSYCQPWRDWK